MRIIAKNFQDYYDSAMAHGQDKSVVFFRESLPIEPTGLRQDIYPVYLNVDNRSYYAEKAIGKWNDAGRLHVYKCTVAFCGRVWNALAVHGRGELTYFYNFDEFLAYVEKEEQELDPSGPKGYRKSYRSGSSIENHYRNWFMEQGTSKHREQLINERIVIASNHRLHLAPGPSIIRQCIVTNGCLKDMQFYKVMDAFTAFQEIDMWIGGVLPKDGPPMAEVTDLDKVSKHGFDKKSFRKSPTKNR